MCIGHICHGIHAAVEGVFHQPLCQFLIVIGIHISIWNRGSWQNIMELVNQNPIPCFIKICRIRIRHGIQPVADRSRFFCFFRKDFIFTVVFLYLPPRCVSTAMVFKIHFPVHFAYVSKIFFFQIIKEFCNCRNFHICAVNGFIDIPVISVTIRAAAVIAVAKHPKRNFDICLCPLLFVPCKCLSHLPIVIICHIIPRRGIRKYS